MVVKTLNMHFNGKAVPVRIVFTGNFFRQVDDDNHFRSLKEMFEYHGADVKLKPSEAVIQLLAEYERFI